jgi:hypothetical protein
MHFYPGVARYDSAEGDSLTVFINEDTIRRMGTTFAGRPVFVEHVETVDENINELRKEADGWVIESFFNQADGKNWVKFIVVTDRGFEAIRRGFRLSNAYIPSQFGPGAQWNGVPYQKEVLEGAFEHLAIVDNPRYEESVILTPDQFKAYNEEKNVDLVRFANSLKTKEKSQMKLFERKKVENATSIENMMVELPISKKEMALTKVVEAYDKIVNMNGYANGDHMVKVGENDEMSVNDLVKKHLEACNELEGMKSKNAKSEDGGEPGPDEDVKNDDEEKIEKAGEKDVGDRGGDDSMDNEDDEEMPAKEDKKKNSYSLEEARAVIAKEKAARLKNANQKGNREDQEDVPVIRLANDQVARGKQLYGSGR